MKDFEILEREAACKVLGIVGENSRISELMSLSKADRKNVANILVKNPRYLPLRSRYCFDFGLEISDVSSAQFLGFQWVPSGPAREKIAELWQSYHLDPSITQYRKHYQRLSTIKSPPAYVPKTNRSEEILQKTCVNKISRALVLSWKNYESFQAKSIHQFGSFGPSTLVRIYEELRESLQLIFETCDHVKLSRLEEIVNPTSPIRFQFSDAISLSANTNLGLARMLIQKAVDEIYEWKFFQLKNSLHELSMAQREDSMWGNVKSLKGTEIDAICRRGLGFQLPDRMDLFNKLKIEIRSFYKATDVPIERNLGNAVGEINEAYDLASRICRRILQIRNSFDMGLPQSERNSEADRIENLLQEFAGDVELLSKKFQRFQRLLEFCAEELGLVKDTSGNDLVIDQSQTATNAAYFINWHYRNQIIDWTRERLHAIQRGNLPEPPEFPLSNDVVAALANSFRRERSVLLKAVPKFVQTYSLLPFDTTSTLSPMQIQSEPNGKVRNRFSDDPDKRMWEELYLQRKDFKKTKGSPLTKDEEFRQSRIDLRAFSLEELKRQLDAAKHRLDYRSRR